MAKTEFLQIRLSPEDRERIVVAAQRDYLDPSTWARRAILRAVEEWEASNHGVENPLSNKTEASKKVDQP